MSPGDPFKVQFVVHDASNRALFSLLTVGIWHFQSFHIQERFWGGQEDGNVDFKWT